MSSMEVGDVPMDFVGEIFGWQEYITGVDESGTLTTKRLNVFECVARNFFGCYQETHLENVLKKIGKTASRENFRFADGEAFKAMRLFSKFTCMDGPCAGSFDESISLESHAMLDDQQRPRRYELRYQPEEPARWEIRAHICDKEGIMKSEIIRFSNASKEGILQIADSMGSCEHDKLFKSELRENMKQFLLHILHHSPQVQGVQFTHERVAQIHGFDSVLVSKESYPKPDGFDQAPAFSLDFIVQLTA